LIKQVIGSIAEPLALVCNTSFDTGRVPDLLKIAQICPIFKKGEKNNIQNYRPISILPTFSKIIEKLVNIRLLNYINKFNILNDCQFGFRPGFSTTMALLKFLDKVTEAIDKKLFVIGIYIDLQKAFDTVNHNILLKKLKFYGIRGKSFEWFQDYLHNRTQYTNFKNNISDCKPVTCGVPQGSILGPLLFILYINDLCNCSEILNFILFADDTNSLYINDTFAELIRIVNIELAHLHTWFLANKLTLNVDKCNYMIFGSKIKDCESPDISINNIKLNRVTSTKFLGIYIDDKLTWNVHISELSKTVARKLGIMNKAKSCLPKKLLLTLYHSLIYPHLSYGIVVWGSVSEQKLNSLFVKQKRAVRIITSSKYNTPSSPLFLELNILKLSDIYKLQVLQIVYKFTNKLYSTSVVDFFSCFNFTSVLKYHNTRCTTLNLNKSIARTEVRNLTIAFAGPRLWNQLDEVVKTLPSISSFKNGFIKWCVARYNCV